MRRMKTIALTTLLVICALGAESFSLPPQPLATLDLSRSSSPKVDGRLSIMNLAFLSNSLIAVSFCLATRECSLLLVHWEDGKLRVLAQSLESLPSKSIHLTSFGQILTTPFGKSPAILYSSDLSRITQLPPLHYASQSGDTVAEPTEAGWELFHLDSRLKLIRKGVGHVQSVSNEAVVTRDGDVIRTETLQGNLLGSFKVTPKCFYEAQLAGDDRLIVSDCKMIRFVDFNGMERSRLSVPKGWGYASSSANGKRVLFNYFSRKVSVLRSAGEIVTAVETLGMGIGDEMDNRQEVEVADVATGKFCFDLRRSFAENSESASQNADLSPSGQFAAIVVGGVISIYQLPAIFETDRQPAAP